MASGLRAFGLGPGPNTSLVDDSMHRESETGVLPPCWKAPPCIPLIPCLPPILVRPPRGSAIAGCCCCCSAAVGGKGKKSLLGVAAETDCSLVPRKPIFPLIGGRHPSVVVCPRFGGRRRRQPVGEDQYCPLHPPSLRGSGWTLRTLKPPSIIGRNFPSSVLALLGPTQSRTQGPGRKKGSLILSSPPPLLTTSKTPAD